MYLQEYNDKKIKIYTFRESLIWQFRGNARNIDRTYNLPLLLRQQLIWDVGCEVTYLLTFLVAVLTKPKTCT